MFPPSNYKILINQVFLAYWGLRHPDPCTKVLTPCFLQHIGVTTPSTKVWTPCFLLHIGVSTPWSLHQGFDTLFSSAYRGYGTLILVPRFRHLVFFCISGLRILIPAPRFGHLVFFYISRLWYLDPNNKVLTPYFSCTSGLRRLDPCTMISTPCFLLHIGVTTPWSLHHNFYTLFSPTYQAYDTLIPAPWFIHLVFIFKSRFLHSAKVFTPCFLLFKSRFQHSAKVLTPCFSFLKTCLPMSEHLVTSPLQSLLSFQKLHSKYFEFHPTFFITISLMTGKRT